MPNAIIIDFLCQVYRLFLVLPQNAGKVGMRNFVLYPLHPDTTQICGRSKTSGPVFWNATEEGRRRILPLVMKMVGRARKPFEDIPKKEGGDRRGNEGARGQSIIRLPVYKKWCLYLTLCMVHGSQWREGYPYIVYSSITSLNIHSKIKSIKNTTAFLGSAICA